MNIASFAVEPIFAHLKIISNIALANFLGKRQNKIHLQTSVKFILELHDPLGRSMGAGHNMNFFWPLTSNSFNNRSSKIGTYIFGFVYITWN